ncbi:BA75_01636T0 [Komagataella pastoris]|uniref:BA75_01636T0 n=1 Tax=Komagataella pastoris TaxID=4922 RepID=A0A1B2J7W4_PICPA|nr:BA75_01636T0 [Komagataella pastoris]
MLGRRPARSLEGNLSSAGHLEDFTVQYSTLPAKYENLSKQKIYSFPKGTRASFHLLNNHPTLFFFFFFSPAVCRLLLQKPDSSFAPTSNHSQKNQFVKQNEDPAKQEKLTRPRWTRLAAS